MPTGRLCGSDGWNTSKARVPCRAAAFAIDVDNPAGMLMFPLGNVERLL
jgi:hypothetical protein